MNYTVFETRLGWMGLLGSGAGLRLVILPKESPGEVIHLITECSGEAIAGDSTFGDLPQRLRRYLDGEPVDFPDMLDMDSASPFKRAVWQATRSIPYGETRSYQWVAEQIGKTRATRAVGRALSKNPLPIVVPCHRVVESNDNLGGFSGGTEMKRALLDIEALKVR